MPWSALPEGILGRVLSRIADDPGYINWGAAMLVCRDWASEVPMCVKRLIVKHAFLDRPHTRNMCVLERLTWVDGLVGPVTSIEVVPFALPSVRELNLRFSIPGAMMSFQIDNGRGFRLLGERFPRLESLSIWDCTVHEVPSWVPLEARLLSLEPLADMASLTALALTGVCWLNVGTIPSKIRTLRMSNMDVPMAELHSAVGGSLTSLEMQDCGLRIGIRGIGMFRDTLNSLVISNCYEIFRRDIEELGTLLHLEMLVIMGAESLFEHYRYNESIEGFGNLTTLRSLTLSATCLITLPEDARVLARLVGLESLIIDGVAIDVMSLRTA
jgi:hypothetical protein